MNPTQIHLALTHVPVIISIAGFVVLVIGMIKPNNTIIKTALWFLVAAGMMAIPVYLTGEGAEEAVEHLPGITENTIETHEELAKIAFAVVCIVGALSLAALVLYNKVQLRKPFIYVILFASLVSGSLMTVTAHLGGAIRHTELVK